MAVLAEKPTVGPGGFIRQSYQMSLARFIRDGWQAVEGRSYRHGWHIDAMAEHLEAVSRGQIKRLLVIVPPQCSKSIIAGTFWPAWEWTFSPFIRWLYASNSDDLAREESLRCRRLIESDWYRQTFGIQWELQDDQNTTDYYQNTAGGARRALGFNAAFTGKKGDRLVIDDANDAEKVYSEAERRRVNRKFDNAISDRHIDLNNDPTVIIGQRVHVNDLIGHVMSQGGWQVLHLREEFIPEKRTKWAVPCHLRGPDGKTSIYTSDPRQRKGELLRPLDFGPKKVRERRRANLMGYQAKHQGDPRSAEGFRFKAAWFKAWRFAADMQHIELEDATGVYRVLPMGALNVRERFGICDPAASKKTAADYTVISTFLITARCDLVWLGCRRQRAELPEQPAMLEDEYRKWKMQWVGVEAVFANRFLAQFAYRQRMVTRDLNPHGLDKLAHATSAIALAESGRIWIPDPMAARLVGFPLLDAIDELTSFTGDDQQDEHDDVVDTLSYGVDHFNMVDTGGQASAAPSFIDAPAADGWQKPDTKPAATPPANSGVPVATGPMAWRRNSPNGP